MREAGFEPANPKDVGLSDVALTTNRFAHNIIFMVFTFCWKGVPPPTIFQQTSLSYFYVKSIALSLSLSLLTIPPS